MISGRTATHYQIIRLWSGMFSIGCHLTLVWVAFLLVLWMPASLYVSIPWLMWLILILVGFNSFAFFFDRLVGYEVERLYHGTTQSLKEWRSDWWYGVLASSITMLIGLSLWVLGRTFLPFGVVLAGALACATAVLIILPSWQARSCRLKGKKSVETEVLILLQQWNVPVRQIHWYADGSLNTLNGMFLPFNRQTIWLTEAVARLSARNIALLIRRESWFLRSGCNLVSIGIVLGWLALGLTAAWLMPAQTSLQQAVSLAAIMTTWCFAALFVWPPLNSMVMTWADRSLRDIATTEEIAALLRLLQETNATDLALSEGKAQVFHPIPPLEIRVNALEPKL
jgi:hypothetical protein